MYPKTRKSFIGHPDAMWFSPNSGKWSFPTATGVYTHNPLVEEAAQLAHIKAHNKRRDTMEPSEHDAYDADHE